MINPHARHDSQSAAESIMGAVGSNPIDEGKRKEVVLGDDLAF